MDSLPRPGTIIKHSYGNKEELYGTVTQPIPEGFPLKELQGGFMIAGNLQFNAMTIADTISSYSYMDDHSKILVQKDYGKISSTHTEHSKDKNKKDARKEERTIIKTSDDHEFRLIY